MGKLFFGDNLYVLRDEIENESVDLIYLDPPFNSKRDYNLLFKTPKGHDSDAQIAAFDDTWHWGEQAEREFAELLHHSNTDISEMIQALRRFLKESDMMAYLVMMGSRLAELHRVLKPSGSLYLHCDPTASHYLKLLLDTIFGADQFRNEIIWRRTGAHGSRKSYGPIHDTILFYTKTNDYYFNIVMRPYMKGHVESRYSLDESGRYKFTSGGNVLSGPGATAGESGAVWRGFNPSAKNRHWAIPGFLSEQMPPEFETLGTLAKLEALYNAGLIEIKEGSAWPTPVRYLDNNDGQPIQDIWAYQPYTEKTVHGTDDGIDQDVAWLGTTDPERLGYQTQKPIGLLERIIKSSCPENGIVLDPFCGCGTAVHAAQKLGREWIGIDITHLAITLIEKRMKDAFQNIVFEVYGTPKDLDGARNLAGRDKYQFQWWACSLVNAQPYQGKKKGSDGGIDGIIFFQDDEVGTKSTGAKKIIVSVKGGEHVNVTMVKDLIATVEREKAAIGIFVTLTKPTQPMITEAISAGFYKSPFGDFQKIQILTIEDLLSETNRPKYPDISSGVYNFKKAKTEKKKVKQDKLL